MKAERQYKEPQQADPIQSKRERTNLSFRDNRSQTITQTKLIKLIQRQESKTCLPNDLKTGVDTLFCQTRGANVNDDEGVDREENSKLKNSYVFSQNKITLSNYHASNTIQLEKKLLKKTIELLAEKIRQLNKDKLDQSERYPVHGKTAYAIPGESGIEVASKRERPRDEQFMRDVAKILHALNPKFQEIQCGLGADGQTVHVASNSEQSKLKSAIDKLRDGKYDQQFRLRLKRSRDERLSERLERFKAWCNSYRFECVIGKEGRHAETKLPFGSISTITGTRRPCGACMMFLKMKKKEYERLSFNPHQGFYWDTDNALESIASEIIKKSGYQDDDEVDGVKEAAIEGKLKKMEEELRLSPTYINHEGGDLREQAKEDSESEAPEFEAPESEDSESGLDHLISIKRTTWDFESRDLEWEGFLKRKRMDDLEFEDLESEAPDFEILKKQKNASSTP